MQLRRTLILSRVWTTLVRVVIRCSRLYRLIGHSRGPLLLCRNLSKATVLSRAWLSPIVVVPTLVIVRWADLLVLAWLKRRLRHL